MNSNKIRINIFWIISFLFIISVTFAQNNNRDSSSDLKVLEEKINSNEKFIEKLDEENTETKHDLERKLEDTRWIIGIIIAFFAIGVPIINYIVKEKLLSKLEKRLNERMNRKINFIVKEKVDSKIEELEKLLQGARTKHSEIEDISIRSYNRYNIIKDIQKLSPENKKEIEIIEQELKETKVEDDYIYEDWSIRGINSYYDKKYETAIYYFTKAIELKFDDYELYYNRGLTYDRLKEYDKAIKDYSRAIALKPKDVEAYYIRGRAYDRLKEYDKAIKDYTKAIELKPLDTNAYNDRGYCYKALGEYKNAISDFTKAIELDNKSFDPELGLAMTYYELNDREKAKEHLQKAKKIEPQLDKGMNGIKELEDLVFYSDTEKSILEKMFEEIK